MRVFVFALPALAGCILQIAWLYGAARDLLYWSALPPKDGADPGVLVLPVYFLYGCVLVANGVLLIRCAVPRRISPRAAP